jgi:hypothetical protein
MQAKVLMRFGYAGVNEAFQVRQLMADIKTNKLDSVRGSIFTKTTLRQLLQPTPTLLLKTHPFIPLKATVKLLLLPVRMTQTAVAATARPNVLRDRSHK